MATFNSLDDYIKNIDSVIKNVKKEIELVLVKVHAEDMTRRIVKRVEMDRLNANGSAFSKYDPDYLKWKQEKKAFVGSKKNFALTREMWSKLGAVNKKRKEGSVEVGIGGKTPDAQIKINVNTKREGISIIEANQKERDAQDKFFDKWLTDYLRKRI